MATPRITVVMPAYNAEATIEAALGSLLAQTCRELDVVVVDDGSTDATAAIVERMAAGAVVPVRLVRCAHRGRAAARNAGLAESTAGFVGFVDADDSAEPAMFERLLSRADTTGADLVVCEYVGVDASTDEVLWTYPEGDMSLYGGAVTERPGLLPAIAGSVCNKLVARSLFAGGVGFPPGRDFEDLATVYRLMGEARRIEKVAEPLYRYRQGYGSSVMGARDERYLEIFDALDVTNEYYGRSGRFEVLRADLERINFTHLIAGRLDDLLRYGDRALRRRFITRAFAHMDRAFPGWRRDDVVRAACGRAAKHVVCTNSAMLTLYTDLRAEPGR
jgi:glycosyltransferase involved in cell wall biosynthesis